MDEANPDWAPSLNLGYKPTTRLKQRRRASAATVLQLKQRDESANTNAVPAARMAAEISDGTKAL